MASRAWHVEKPARVTSAFACAAFIAAACAPIAAVVWFYLVRGIPIPHMTRDVAATAGIHPFTGFLSNLGILLWATSAAIWIFSSMLLRAFNARLEASLALGFGLLSSYLAFDDLFQIHETLALSSVRIDEKIVYALLAIAVFVLVIRFSVLLRQGPVWLLAAAFLLLGVSVSVDVVYFRLELERLGHWAYLLEDGPKWIGILCWSAYAILWCKEAVLSRPARV